MLINVPVRHIKILQQTAVSTRGYRPCICCGGLSRLCLPLGPATESQHSAKGRFLVQIINEGELLLHVQHLHHH